MRENNRIGWFFMIIAVLLFVIMTKLAFSQPYHIEKTDCYDENHRKIIGLECEQKVSDGDDSIYLIALPFFFCFIISLHYFTKFE